MQFLMATVCVEWGVDDDKIFQVGDENIWNGIPIVVTLHSESCFFAWLPLQNFLEAKSPIVFFLILNELHSAAENFTFLMRINYIPYENTLHSLPEYTSFS